MTGRGVLITPYKNRGSKTKGKCNGFLYPAWLARIASVPVATSPELPNRVELEASANAVIASGGRSLAQASVTIQ